MIRGYGIPKNKLDDLESLEDKPPEVIVQWLRANAPRHAKIKILSERGTKVYRNR